jgi:hypothetical protein
VAKLPIAPMERLLFLAGEGYSNPGGLKFTKPDAF